MMKHFNKKGAVALTGMIAFVMLGQVAVVAQTESASPSTQIIEPDSGVEAAEFVTINVKDANISEVLKAYSLQTGQSIVCLLYTSDAADEYQRV